MSKKFMCTLTTMCLVRNGTKVLLQKRTDKNWSGAAFPGGHVEEGESVTESVIREVYEETGLKIVSPRLVGIKDWRQDGGRYIVFLYIADSFTGELRGSSEGDVLWVERDKLDECDLASDFSPMLRVFEDAAANEMFWRDDSWVYE